MDFVARLEDFLRDLGAESRKKHPGVKEASERAVLRLRTLQNVYASAVRKAASSGTEHPTTSLFQSQDLLHPFLLAANYPNASTKLLEISFKAMRLLMESNAVCAGDGIHMVRVWTIQAHVIMSQYYQKTNYKSAHKHGNTSTAAAAGSTINSKNSSDVPPKNVSGIGSSSSTTSSSWFGIGGLIGMGGGSSNNNSSSNNNDGGGTITVVSASSQVASTAAAAVDLGTKSIQNAVSSSSGQSGQYTASSNKDMEKIALEILSCLLQLTELMKQEHQSTDMWTQSVSLCCLLLDFQKTVQQAAHSTLPQVLGILYQTTDHHKFNLQTWEDLLLLASYGPNKKPPTLNGAFAQCRLDAAASAKAPPPPSAEFALELMATVLRGKPDLLAVSDKYLSKTMGVTVALLQQISVNSVHFNLNKALRIYQWTLAVLQTQSTVAVNECRELLQHVLKPIRTATEACRPQQDFEDSFVYVGDSSEPSSSGGNTTALLSNRSNRRLSSSADHSNPQQQQNLNRQHYKSLLPVALLWKTGLAMETIYLLLSHYSQVQNSFSNVGDYSTGNDDDDNAQALYGLFDRQTTVIISETLSDFATVGASCQDHILQLVDVCDRTSNNGSENAVNVADGANSNNDSLMKSFTHEDDKHRSQNDNIKPMLFHRAEQLTKSGVGGVDILFNNSDNSKAASKSASKTTTANDRKQSPNSSKDAPVMGETLWVAFHGILEITNEILPNSSPDIKESLVESAFAPSLSTLQHYLKRLPGASDLARQSLKGYTQLANLCMPSATAEQKLQRKALLSSLCKLSLPSWGKHNASSQLYNHHVRALICLLRIVHNHYNNILSEWNVVMLTFEELSVMAISSPFMSDQMYHAALAISAVFGRFAPFSTCFSAKSLQEFIEALASVSSLATRERDMITSSDNAVLDRVLVSSDPTAPGGKGGGDGKASIGGKLVSLGVRAIYGGQSNEGNELEDTDDVPIAKRTKSSFYEAYRNDFVSRLETTTTSTLRPDLAAMLPFGLALLADVAMANSFRYGICVSPISRHICSFASVAPAIRTPVMDTAAMLILVRISKDKNLVSFKAPAKLVYADPKQHQLLAVEPTVSAEEGSADVDVPQAELFGPICDSIRTVTSAAVAEAATTILLSMLENIGHTLAGEVWVVIISGVASLSGETTERSSSEWSNCCLLGFRCLKLIVDDFLDYLPPPASASAPVLASLLECCSSFGRSRHDVNTSLTAIGVLWTIADQDAGPNAIDRALSKLVELASDSRPEVRNCSVNTLFSCIVGRGNTFSSSQWRSCICDTVFGVCDAAILKVSDSEDGKVDLNGEKVDKSRSRYKVSVHHSRDSAGKQWLLTQSLALQGLSRVLRSFFSILLDHVDDESFGHTKDSKRVDDKEIAWKENPWLVDAWSRLLDLALQAAAQEGGRDTVDLRSAGIDLLVLCAQLSCKAGIAAAIMPARVGTNMQVVNGALRGVGAASPKSTKAAEQRLHSQTTEAYRQVMFSSAMERIDLYREFIEAGEAQRRLDVLRREQAGEKERDQEGMEATQVQVLQKFIGSLGNLYDCCKDDEMSNQGQLNVNHTILRFFLKSETEIFGFEYRFVRLLTTLAIDASGGPRFLSQAQRAAIDLLRSMMKQGSSEALLQCVCRAGPWLFWKDDGAKDKNASVSDHHGASVISCEMASLIAEEVTAEYFSHECKALALWLALSQLSSDIFLSERGSEGRRKTYYKQFIPLLSEGLKSSLALQVKLSPPLNNQVEWLLISDIWKRLCDALSHMLTPVPDAANLPKISRAAEVLEITMVAIEFVTSTSCDGLCAVLSKGASEALSVEQANRPLAGEDSDSEMARRRQKYHDDALAIFKTCYAGLCIKKPDDPALLAITDKAFSDALTSIHESQGGGPKNGVSVDLFLMVCQAFDENKGLEAIIISSFPLLCRLIQTGDSDVRNAAASALGSADLRQLLADARLRYEDAERRAQEAEQTAQDLAAALADMQRKNDALQRR